MKLHFFSRTELHSRTDFRLFYIRQNLLTLQTASLIYLLLSVMIRIVLELVSSNLRTINHMEEYDASNWLSIILLPAFYFGSRQLRAIFDLDKKYALVAELVTFLFTMFVIINLMRASFYTMHNPRNTLVMYMIGLIITGLFFTFEFYGTIAIALITGLTFAITLRYYQSLPSELFLNNIASFILLTIFFSISRFTFSYRADNFLKLKAIEDKNREIERASQVKNEILGVVAHDLRNPMAAIRALAMMMETEDNVNEDNQENLQMIKTACDKATSIINDLLETAHNETGNEFEMEQVDLNKFLLFVVDEWQKNKTDKVSILFYGTRQPVLAMINREKLQRALDNLISNAIKFSAASEHIEVLLKEGPGVAKIVVKDFGVGIPADLLPYIFDRFSKASRKGLRGEESVGLGLSIVREIVRKHNGEISVESVEKSGTTFMIKLPSLPKS
jgi:signal transduction histidine kinase